MGKVIKKTILIFEKQEKIYSLAAELLQQQHYEIVVACDVKEARQLIKKHCVCIIIADPECPEIERLRRNSGDVYSQTPIIYINCLFGFEVILSRAEQEGNYFLVEDFDATTLLNRINRIIPRKYLYTQSATDGDTLLTPQEKRILRLLEKGYTNKEIADTLGLTAATVRTYNYVLFQKLSVKNRTHAIMVAKEASLF